MAEPKIRFREYEGEYNLDKIGNLTDSYSGGTPSAGCSEYYGGKIPFIRSGEIHNDKTELFLTEIGYSVSSAKMVEKGAILYAMYGATSGEVDVCKIKGAINQAILAINPQNDIDSYFLIYLLQNKKKSIISTFLQGGQGNLSGSMIKNITIEYPDIIEQQQIASYFKSLDALIQVTTKKIISLKQLKSASLISMFPQAGETKPRVRFKGFKEDWKKSKLNQLANRITRKNKKLETQLPLTISAIDGLISQDSFFNDIVASSNLSGYYLIREGEFAYNKSYSNGYPFGVVKRLEKYNMGALSTLYIVFALNTNILSDYVAYFFDTTLWHNEVAKSAAEGARNHGLLNINTDDFLGIEILFPPSLSEQRQIASFFRSLDTQIFLETQRLDKLKQIKSACLDKMFV